MILPLFLIIIGSAFLLKNLGYISGSTWGIIWPALLIVFGIGILLRKGRDDFFWKECCGWRKKEIEDKKDNI
ncbi:MAG: DUF5668 domain-containing protein [Candidatus Azambacteria bacterium]|nr:DUF5668 domain-containing protein [Candidatus Azambacteria bacterium]